MKPAKVAFVAVLKPTDDVRLFHKLASCWLKLGFEVHCLGYEGTLRTQSDKYTYFHTIFRHTRSHWQRLLVGFRLVWYLCFIQPKMLVCGAVELLPFCVFYKILALLFFKKVHLSYDVQENYASNISFTQTYPKFFRFILAKLVRFCEWCCSWWVDMFLLAEKCYVQELPFLGKNYLVVENKFSQEHLQKENSARAAIYPLQIVHTGTLSAEYGTEKVLEIAQHLSEQGVCYQMSIIGKCSKSSLLLRLQNLHKEHIFTQISLSPISYENILTAYSNAHIALMPYQINKAYQNRIPTKFYEAMAHNVWIWVQENPAWRAFFEEYKYPKVLFSDFWAEKVNFGFPSEINFLDERKYNNPNIFWENEAKKIFVWLQNLNFLEKSSKKS